MSGLTSAVLLVAGHGAAAHATVPANEDGLVAFQRNADAGGEIWVLDPFTASPGSGAVKVTSGPEPEARPAYGPRLDADPADPAARFRWPLAYQRFAAGQWDIWGRVAYGTTPETPSFDPPGPEVAGPGNQTQPAYSLPIAGQPLLAYISDETGAPEVWFRDAAGVRHRLTTDGAGYAAPDFAGRTRPGPLDDVADPVRQRIGLTFESTRGGTRAIWALDVELDVAGQFVAQHDLRRVAAGPEALSEPSWLVTNDFEFADRAIVHHRTNTVAFSTAQAGRTFLDYAEEPWSQPLGGSVTPAVPFAAPAAITRVALTGNPGGDETPSWAPNGDFLAFTRATGANRDLWVVRPDGTGLRRLTGAAVPDLYPSWQPAQESSVEKVGGHVQPGPVDRSGPGGPGPRDRGNPPPRARTSPGLAIRRVRWRGRAVNVRGRAATGLAGRVRLTFRCLGRGRTRSAALVFASTGPFQATLHTTRACRRARRGVVVAAYGGDAGHTAQRVRRAARRR